MIVSCFCPCVNNNPILIIDPTGKNRCNPVLGAVVGAIGGGLIGTGVGGLVGGTAGAVSIGGAGTLVAPGVGTIAGGVVGGGVGALGGAAVGGSIGTIIGGAIGYWHCSREDSVPRTKCGPDEDGRNTCKKLFDLCLDHPWQPEWNRKMFGDRKDCGTCYRGCIAEQGVWDFNKCPVSIDY